MKYYEAIISILILLSILGLSIYLYVNTRSVKDSLDTQDDIIERVLIDISFLIGGHLEGSVELKDEVFTITLQNNTAYLQIQDNLAPENVVDSGGMHSAFRLFNSKKDNAVMIPTPAAPTVEETFIREYGGIIINSDRFSILDSQPPCTLEFTENDNKSITTVKGQLMQMQFNAESTQLTFDIATETAFKLDTNPTFVVVQVNKFYNIFQSLNIESNRKVCDNYVDDVLNESTSFGTCVDLAVSTVSKAGVKFAL